jgi:hypothetical protein
MFQFSIHTIICTILIESKPKDVSSQRILFVKVTYDSKNHETISFNDFVTKLALSNIVYYRHLLANRTFLKYH